MKENFKLSLKENLNSKERKKMQKGITLVALVVTIVVLLILAGITIMALTGENGIIATAQNAKKQNTKAELKEQIERAVINSRLSILSDANMDLSKLEVELKKIDGLNIESKGEDGKLPWVVTVNGYKFKINENGTVEVVEGITLSKTTLKLVAGESETITAILTEGTTGTVTWESSDESIVTVNNGVVTAVGNFGTATIKAKVEGASFDPASCTVTIIEKVTSIAVNSATLEIEQGGTAKIVATPTPSTNVEDLVFSSNNNKITVEEKGTVAEDGKVTAKITVASDATVGATATITVKGEKTGEVAGKTATCTITVKKAVEPEAGDFVNYTAGTWTQGDLEKLGVQFNADGEIISNGDLYAGANLPTSSTPYKFGGFTLNQSKDQSITPYSTYANTYSGWRILSKNADGTYNIIHAGTPEGYFHPYEINGADKSEYILNKDTTNTNLTEAIKSGLTTRDWSMYENLAYAVANSARFVTYDEMKRLSGSNTLRKTGSFYWLSRAGNSLSLYYVTDDGSTDYSRYYYCFGVRPVVSLQSNVKFKAKEGDTSHKTEATAWQLEI